MLSLPEHDLVVYFPHTGTGIALRGVGTLFMLAATVHVILKDKAEKRAAQETDEPDDDRA